MSIAMHVSSDYRRGFYSIERPMTPLVMNATVKTSKVDEMRRCHCCMGKRVTRLGLEPRTY